MKAHQDEYLAFIDSWLNSMDDETFLKKYAAVENGIGPTIASVLENLPVDMYVYETKQTVNTDEIQLTDFPSIEYFAAKERSQSFANESDNHYAANDEHYSHLLAA